MYANFIVYIAVHYVLYLLQASTNGVLSFGETFIDFTSTALPQVTAAVPLVAPLWRDFDFSASGSIYYRQANDSETLNRVRRMITDVNPGLNAYQPTLAVVVTWFEARLHGHTSDFNVSYKKWDLVSTIDLDDPSYGA
jgi:hypothetical protein